MTLRTRFHNAEVLKPNLSTSELQKMLTIQGGMLQQAVVRTDFGTLLDELCLMAESFTPNAVAAIMLYDSNRDALFVENGPSLVPEAIEAFNGLRMGEGSCGNAVYHDEAMYVCSTLEDPRWTNISDIAIRFKIHSCFSFPIPDKGGKPIGSFSISSFEPRTPSGFHRALLETCASMCSVVLQRRDDEEVRKRLLEEQVKADRIKGLGTLAGGIAHDFNNLLAAIMGNVDLAESSLPIGPEKDCLQLANKAIESASELTRQLVSVAKGGSLVCGPNDIVEIVRNSTEFALHGSNVSFELVGFELLPSPVMEIDGGQIGQLIQNLVLNARQSMPQGGSVRIECGLEDLTDHLVLNDGKYIRITVTDTGDGIDSDVLARLFEPYFTMRDGGSGLGLFLCYSIVRRHQGHIDVDSKRGYGTVFTIYLPWSECETTASGTKQIERQKVQAKVLIMDDDRLVRRTLSRMLVHLGCEVQEAKDGNEAVECFDRQKKAMQPFDITILDLTVPGGMGGMEAMSQIKILDPTAKVVVSTGYSAHNTSANYEEAGFDAAMLKPYRMEDLKNVLQEIVE